MVNGPHWFIIYQTASRIKKTTLCMNQIWTCSMLSYHTSAYWRGHAHTERDGLLDVRDGRLNGRTAHRRDRRLSFFGNHYTSGRQTRYIWHKCALSNVVEQEIILAIQEAIRMLSRRAGSLVKLINPNRFGSEFLLEWRYFAIPYYYYLYADL